tara:strand:- start:814 stop:1068 length:255 start_codon:yes stop_codon:yes gene_type:complete
MANYPPFLEACHAINPAIPTPPITETNGNKSIIAATSVNPAVVASVDAVPVDEMIVGKIARNATKTTTAMIIEVILFVFILFPY